MSEMVERLVGILIKVTSTFSCGSMDYEDAARALIAAMREPTSEMHAAGDAALSSSDYQCECDELKIWHAMIDAALAPRNDDRGAAPAHREGNLNQ